MSDSMRRTGRTSRMLELARKAIREGKTVGIVGTTMLQAEYLCRLVPGAKPFSFDRPEKLVGLSNIELFEDHTVTERIKDIFSYIHYRDLAKLSHIPWR